MPVTVFGFPRSTYVKVVRLILTEKGVDYRFHDTETEMYLPVHLARHPFGRVPVLQHDDFLLYETSAIAAYVDEVFDEPKLTPVEPRRPTSRGRNWWSRRASVVHFIRRTVPRRKNSCLKRTTGCTNPKRPTTSSAVKLPGFRSVDELWWFLISGEMP